MRVSIGKTELSICLFVFACLFFHVIYKISIPKVPFKIMHTTFKEWVWLQTLQHFNTLQLSSTDWTVLVAHLISISPSPSFGNKNYAVAVLMCACNALHEGRARFWQPIDGFSKPKKAPLKKTEPHNTHSTPRFGNFYDLFTCLLLWTLKAFDLSGFLDIHSWFYILEFK